MNTRDPRRDGCPAERLEFWRERLIVAERLGRPAHIAHVRARVEELEDIQDVPWFGSVPLPRPRPANYIEGEPSWTRKN